ncbi:MAG: SMC-Scp complex subunit ScpB [Acutalibacteraceae bacterium]|nr:SMC-Scp complex subunit ScpB [Oscillospiraceae bacterium]
MNIKKLQAMLEAVLFAVGEPIEISRLSQSLEVDEETLSSVLANLSASLEERNSGLCLLKLDDKYQLCTRSEFAADIRKVLEIKKNAPLSNAAFEVLAIIAYNQPVTKSFVEQIRGVDCSGVMASLCQKSLIEEKGRLDLPGRPLIYGTTPEFLRCFCISSLDELPSLPSDDPQVTMEETIGNEAKEETEDENFSETD